MEEETLCPGLLDDIMGAILNIVHARAVGKFMLTCKRCNNPSRTIIHLREFYSTTESQLTFPYWDFVSRLEFLRCEDSLFSRATPTFEVESAHIGTVDGLHLDAAFKYLQKAKHLEINYPTSFRDVWRYISKYNWPCLESLTISHIVYSGTERGPLEVPAITMPALRRLKLTCLCHGHLFRHSIWQQLECWEVGTICRYCKELFAVVDVSRLKIKKRNCNLLTGNLFDEYYGNELRHRDPDDFSGQSRDIVLAGRARKRLYELTGYKNVPIPVGFDPKIMAIALSDLDEYRLSSFSRDSVFDCIKLANCTDLKFDFPRRWFDDPIDIDTMLTLLRNPAQMQMFFYWGYYDFLKDARAVAKQNGVSDDTVRYYIRAALSQYENYKDSALSLILHSEFDIHDLCGVYYQHHQDNLLDQALRQMNENITSLTIGNVLFINELPRLLKEKSEEFLKNTLRQELLKYYCQFCTTCKYI